MITQEKIAQLPKDRETLFYFNVREIPPKTDKKKCDASHYAARGNDSNLLIVFYVQIMPDDFVMQLHRF
ncbi:hypothetical protein GR02_27360 [Escherichia coli]|nr:hypothetical protein GR02_27360 [Escherichia coli]